MLKRPRQLEPSERDALLALDVPADLATLDRDGFPHVTPLWFLWRNGAFYMTSIADRPHLNRLHRNPRAGLSVNIEGRERADGQRPNRQVRAIGNVELSPDDQATWTTLITERYVHGPSAATVIADRAADQRVVICLRPTRLVAVASV